MCAKHMLDTKDLWKKCHDMLGRTEIELMDGTALTT